MDADISGEYVDDDKPYQTEGDGEIGTFESGSQENGKIRDERQQSESAKSKNYLKKL